MANEMKFRPPELPSIQTQEQWTWWKRCFTEGLAINEITEDNNKLTFLRSYAGSDLFSILVQATTFDNAIALLDAQFKKPSRVIYARHQVLSAQQGDDNIAEFTKRLRLLVERCECDTLTIQEHFF